MIKLRKDKVRKYLTPYKRMEPVIAGSGKPGAFDEKGVDCPFVFRHNGKFYMVYTGFGGKRYQSAMAVSDDLLHWTPRGLIIPRDPEDSDRWDKIGCCVTWIIKESDNFYDTPALKKIDGKYWLVYHSYPSTGYEAGPAEIGLAWCEEETLSEWHRLDQPVFSWKDGGDWERGGLYKACIITHEDTYYLFYNAKDTQKRWIEQTGMATSKDLLHWERCEENPVLGITEGAWDGRFVSDPYVLRDGDHFVNFYFGYDNGHAQEGLAFSDDLIHWEKVAEPIITNTPGGLDEEHAHKAAICYFNGVLYHFYCATRPHREGDATEVYKAFRTIAVATDKPVAG